MYSWSIKNGKNQFGDQSIHHAYGLKCLKGKIYINIFYYIIILEKNKIIIYFYFLFLYI